jgi:hypothetical protein
LYAVCSLLFALLFVRAGCLAEWYAARHEPRKPAAAKPTLRVYAGGAKQRPPARPPGGA